MHLAYFRNLLVDRSLNVRVLPKPEPPGFASFDEYCTFLKTGLRRIAVNASASERHIKYTPLTTVSSGYDSAACAALSREIGCQAAVTFCTARPDAGSKLEAEDSGQAVAEALGLKTKVFNRADYMTKAGHPEAEFVVCGDLGQDMPWSAFESSFEQRLVLSGTHGDIIWDRHFEPHGRDIIRKAMDGCSLMEFKMRVGFIHVLPAFFAALSHPSVHAISNSSEMQAWQVGGRYDRPIPRRIAEESGVGRRLFGQKKSAVAVLLNRDASLQGEMSPESFASLKRFYRKHKGKRRWLNQFAYDTLFTAYIVYYWVCVRLHLTSVLPCPVAPRFREPPGLPSFMVHWAFPLVRRRYEAARTTLDG